MKTGRRVSSGTLWVISVISGILIVLAFVIRADVQAIKGEVVLPSEQSGRVLPIQMCFDRKVTITAKSPEFFLFASKNQVMGVETEDNMTVGAAVTTEGCWTLTDGRDVTVAFESKDATPVWVTMPYNLLDMVLMVFLMIIFTLIVVILLAFGCFAFQIQIDGISNEDGPGAMNENS